MKNAQPEATSGKTLDFINFVPQFALLSTDDDPAKRERAQTYLGKVCRFIPSG